MRRQGSRTYKSKVESLNWVVVTAPLSRIHLFSILPDYYFWSFLQLIQGLRMVKSETRLAFAPSAWDEIHGIDKNGDAFHVPTELVNTWVAKTVV